MVLDLEPILTILNIHVKKHIGIDTLNSQDNYEWSRTLNLS